MTALGGYILGRPRLAGGGAFAEGMGYAPPPNLVTCPGAIGGVGDIHLPDALAIWGRHPLCGETGTHFGSGAALAVGGEGAPNLPAVFVPPATWGES